MGRSRDRSKQVLARSKPVLEADSKQVLVCSKQELAHSKQELGRSKHVELAGGSAGRSERDEHKDRKKLRSHSWVQLLRIHNWTRDDPTYELLLTLERSTG